MIFGPVPQIMMAFMAGNDGPADARMSGSYSAGDVVFPTGRGSSLALRGWDFFNPYGPGVSQKTSLACQSKDVSVW